MKLIKALVQNSNHPVLDGPKPCAGVARQPAAGRGIACNLTSN